MPFFDIFNSFNKKKYCCSDELWMIFIWFINLPDISKQLSWIGKILLSENLIWNLFWTGLGNNNSNDYSNSSPSARSQRDFFRYIGVQLTAPGAAGGYHFELSGV